MTPTLREAAKERVAAEKEKHQLHLGGEPNCRCVRAHYALEAALAAEPEVPESKVERVEVVGWDSRGFIGTTHYPINRKDGWTIYAERPLPPKPKSRAEELADWVTDLTGGLVEPQRSKGKEVAAMLRESRTEKGA